MKKILLSIATVIFAFCAVSCNNDDGDPYELVLGSLEATGITTSVTDWYGTKLTAESGYTQFPTLEDYQRQLIMLGFTYPDGMERVRGTGKTMAVRPSLYAVSPTKQPVELGFSTYDDPVIMLAGEESNGLFTVCNFIYFQPYAELFKGNKTGENTYAMWDFDVEISREISADNTIDMYLKFFANQKDDEERAAYGNLGTYFYYAVDMSDASFLIDGLDETQTYTVKLHYDSYTVNEVASDYINYDKNTVVEKTVSVKWTPNKPYIDQSVF